MKNRATLYLRSSKDRSDVSIDAQRRALHDLAVQRGLQVVGEYADAVESGKDEDRPGFQSMLRDLKSAGRAWEHVLVLDTSRVARRQMISLIFEQECERRGVSVTYKNVPDADPVTTMLLKSILRAMDEWHSLTSRAKGLAGMAENVKQGWRAGGRAPRGYRLEYHATGAVRDGEAVMKSKLVPDEDAPLMAAYLKARAAGELRGRVLERLGVDWPESSLNHSEWQALTYAGHTVWNVHQEREGGASKTGERRRPRSEWVIQKGTHEPLITEEEAEALLARMEEQKSLRLRRDAPQYLLTGLLRTPTGEAWAGDSSNSYRVGKGRRVSAYRVDEPVVDGLLALLASPEAAQRVADQMRASLAQPVDGRTMAGLEKKLKGLDQQIQRTVDLAAQMQDPAPVLRRVADLEGERAQIAQRLEEMRRAAAEAEAVEHISATDVQVLLQHLRAEMEEKKGSVTDLRAVLASLIETVELCPETLACRVNLRLSGVIVASRRGAEMSPVRFSAPVEVLRRTRRAA